MFCKNCGKQLLENEKFCSNCGASISGPIVVGGAIYGVASSGLRFANYLVDYFVILISLVILIIIAVAISPASNGNPIYSIIGLIYVPAFYLFFEGIWQRTPGKWLTKTRVVMQDGSKPDFKHILGRSFARIIPFEAFSFLFGPVGWHDSLSGTLVVPAAYSVEEIKQINPKQTAPSKTSTIIIIVVCVFVLIAVIGLLSSIVLLALNGAREKSRDATRLADVRQMASAMELYFNDKGQYPINLNDMLPTYIGVLPIAPTPADGNCTLDQNQFNYTPIQDGASYSLTFCLGQDTGGYPAGIETLTPQGIGQASSDNNQTQDQTQDPVAQADYQEGYKAGYTDGRAASGKILDSYSPPATTARRPNYNQGYTDGFTQGCSDGNFNCTTQINQLQQDFQQTSNTPSIDNNSVQ